MSAVCGRSGSTRLASVATSATRGRNTAATTRLNAVWKLIAIRPGSDSIIASHDAIGVTRNSTGSATAARMMRLPSGTRRPAGGEAGEREEWRERAADVGAKHQRERERDGQGAGRRERHHEQHDRQARMHQPRDRGRGEESEHRLAGKPGRAASGTARSP